MYIPDVLPDPIFNNIINPVSLDNIVIQSGFNSNATFYRDLFNTNIIVALPIGTGPDVNNLYTSPDAFIPINAFNSVQSATEVNFPNNQYASISQSLTMNHNLLIQYKLIRGNGLNFTNQRQLITTLVDSTNTPYNATIFSNEMPSTGAQDELIINQFITHTAGDIVKIKFKLVQDQLNAGQSGTLLTIFRISWTISG